MSAPTTQIVVRSGSESLWRAETPPRDIQEIWFALARRQWRSLVLVPADEGGSAAAIATSLADVGRRLQDAPVTFFLMASPLDYASAAKIMAAFASTRQGSGALTVASTGKVIVAVQPVIAEPLGLAVTEAADAVVLCIEMGRAHLSAARRSIELVGRDRIAGCLLV
jgi:hypothetical protein